MGTASYDQDVIAWSREQAALLRAGRFSQLDIEHLADEIEDVGKSEKREVASRMAVLLAHLLKWQHQPARRSRSWEITIKTRREGLAIALRETPSLKSVMRDADWQRTAWIDAVDRATREAGLDVDFGEVCPWSMDQVLAGGWMPGE